MEQRRLEEQLVRDHLPLVHYAVSDLAAKVPRHVSRDDLTSAGMAGLARAARSFDPSRGIAFDHYANGRIRGALLDELRERDWASRSVRAKSRQISSATEELTSTLRREPSPDEVARHLGIDPASVDAVSRDVHRAVVLNYDAMVVQGDADSVLPADHRSPDHVLLERERRAYLLDAVAALPERLRTVVVGYFFDERPMQVLATELGVSESRISQMRAEALALLKDGMNSQLDPEAVVERSRASQRVIRRKAAYYSAVAAGSDFRSRVSAVPTHAAKAAGSAA